MFVFNTVPVGQLIGQLPEELEEEDELDELDEVEPEDELLELAPQTIGGGDPIQKEHEPQQQSIIPPPQQNGVYPGIGQFAAQPEVHTKEGPIQLHVPPEEDDELEDELEEDEELLDELGVQVLLQSTLQYQSNTPPTVAG